TCQQADCVRSWHQPPNDRELPGQSDDQDAGCEPLRPRAHGLDRRNSRFERRRLQRILSDAIAVQPIEPPFRGFEPYQSGDAGSAAYCHTRAVHPEPRAQAKAMKNQDKASNSGVVVIVVSDDLAVRNSLKFWLEIEGLTVRGYVSGADLFGAGDL